MNFVEQAYMYRFTHREGTKFKFRGRLHGCQGDLRTRQHACGTDIQCFLPRCHSITVLFTTANQDDVFDRTWKTSTIDDSKSDEETVLF